MAPRLSLCQSPRWQSAMPRVNSTQRWAERGRLRLLRSSQGAVERKLPDWPHAVIFDLDGTLIDSAPDLANALNRMLANRGLAPFGVEEAKTMVGGGIAKLVERALIKRGISLSELPALTTDFIHFYSENITTETTLY